MKLLHPGISLRRTRHFSRFAVMAVAALLCAHLSAAPLVLDSAPNVTLRSQTDVNLEGVSEAPDGKLYVLGFFQFIDNVEQRAFARLNPDGSLDSAYGVPTVDGQITHLAAADDGKLFLAGTFFRVGGVTRPGIARLNADGTLDATFNPVSPAEGFIREVAALADGGCYVLTFSFSGVQVQRYTATGQLDATYSNISIPEFANDWALGPNGELAFVLSNNPGPAGVPVFGSDGAVSGLTSGIPSNFSVFGAAFEPSGALVVSGQQFSGPGPGLLRIQPNGELDPGFTGTAAFPFGFGGGHLTRLAGGNLVSLGNMGPGVPPPHLARYSATGVYLGGHSIENSLEGYGVNLELLALRNGDFLLSGRFLELDGTYAPMVARLSAEGQVNSDFFVDIATRGRIDVIVPLASGAAIIGGGFTEIGTAQVGNLAVINSSGSVGAGLPTIPFGVSNGFATSDGGAVVFGPFPSFSAGGATGVARLTSDLQLDASFLAGVSLFGFNAGLARPDGSVVLAGSFGQFWSGPGPAPASYLTRVRPDGTIDPTFFNHSTLEGGFGGIRAIGADASGRLLIAGPFTSFQGEPRAGLARTSPDGVLDPTFVASVPITVSSFQPPPITVLPDGRFYVVARRTDIPVFQDTLLRFLPDGQLDESFTLPVPVRVNRYHAEADGTLYLVVGPQVMRVLPNGAVDASFVCAANVPPTVVTVDSSGRVLIGGGFARVNGQPREGIARFSAPFGVSIDGPAELTVSLLSDLTLTSTVVGGSSNVTYQWYRDGQLLAGATGSSLTLTHIVPKHEGSYSVVASSDGNQAASSPVVIHVRRGKPDR